MPIASNPNAKTEFWLQSDADTPAESRPVFLIRFMTRAEHDQVEDLRARASESKDDVESWRLAIDALRIGVVGAKNMKTEDGDPWTFDLENIDQVLTQRELWELLWRYPGAVRMCGADKKKSHSRSASDGESSVNSVEQAAA